MIGNHTIRNTARFRRSTDSKRRGMILFIVSIVIAMVAVGALALLSLLTTEYEATVLRGDEIQAGQLVQSGIELIAQTIDTPVVESIDSSANPSENSLPETMPAEMPDLSGGPTADLSGSSFFTGSPSSTLPISDSLYDNPVLFHGVEAIPARFGRPARGAGRFTVFSPRIEQNRLRGIRFGLVNESTRLHLGTVLQWENESPGQGSRSLMKLPGMTPSMADSILDWIDPDKTSRPSGAEFEYYERTGVPYRPRNAVPTTLEELLLVRDVTRMLLFGNDESFSYGAKMSDLQRARIEIDIQTDSLFQEHSQEHSQEHVQGQPGEREESSRSGSGSSAGIASSDEVSDFFAGSLDDGAVDTSRLDDEQSTATLPWCFLLTTLSAEKLVDPRGNAKIFLNDGNLEFLEQQLRRHLDDESVCFVLAWRKGKKKIDDPIDLLDATVTVDAEEGNDGKAGKNEKSEKTGEIQGEAAKQEELKSPFTLADAVGEEKFLKLLDYATSSSDVVVSGRINVNEAPRIVLEAIPELDSQTVSKILARRNASDGAASGEASIFSSENLSDEPTGRVRDDRFRHPVWLLSEKIVDKETMKKLSKRLTTGGDVYRAQVVGFFDGQGTVSRSEVVVDSTVKPPRQIFSKDLTMFGSGFD